jgi:hypothetical protein
MAELIFMLTRDDRTVPDAFEAYERVRHLPLSYVGFKDVGASPATLAELTHAIQADGRNAVLEIVAPQRRLELAAVHRGLELGVDVVMGGVHTGEALRLLQCTPIRFLPFAGRVTGHPSALRGSVTEIVASAQALAATDGVAGIDLLAWRWRQGDGAQLARAVIAALGAPVVIAGNVDSLHRVRVVNGLGAWAFTVGSAAFAGRFAAGGLAAQLAAIQTAASAPAPAEQP